MKKKWINGIILILIIINLLITPCIAITEAEADEIISDVLLYNSGAGGVTWKDLDNEKISEITSKLEEVMSNFDTIYPQGHIRRNSKTEIETILNSLKTSTNVNAEKPSFENFWESAMNFLRIGQKGGNQVSLEEAKVELEGLAKILIIASIIILYIFYYLIIKIEVLRQNIPKLMIGTFIIQLIIYIFFYNKTYYHIDVVREPMIRFLFFEAMLLGTYFRINKEKYMNKNNKINWVILLISMLTYFISKLIFCSSLKIYINIIIYVHIFIFLINS